MDRRIGQATKLAFYDGQDWFGPFEEPWESFEGLPRNCIDKVLNFDAAVENLEEHGLIRPWYHFLVHVPRLNPISGSPATEPFYRFRAPSESGYHRLRAALVGAMTGRKVRILEPGWPDRVVVCKKFIF